MFLCNNMDFSINLIIHIRKYRFVYLPMNDKQKIYIDEWKKITHE